MNPVLQDAAFQQLRDLIYEKSGIFVPETKRNLLEKKLASRLEQRKLNTFDEYLPYVQSSLHEDEIAKLLDAVTVNETYFFREPEQLDVFTDFLVARIVENKRFPHIRVWSAACSTGEEAYTLAMMHLEKKSCINMEIIASDISNAALEAAKKGIYGSYSMRAVKEPYVSKYFRKNGTGHEIDALVKKAVMFLHVNLADEKRVRSLQAMDVIFCRNVLIYFDDKARQKTASLLYDSLRPGGYLIIGSTESLHTITHAFQPVLLNNAIAYQKGRT